jgi:hypothetical protein
MKKEGDVPMIKKENKVLKYFSLISGIITIVYIWLYDRMLEPNPLYGDHASTASNVGRDHWIEFIFWGMLIAGSIVLNLNYSLEKFQINRKMPRVLSILGLFAMFGVVMCKNEKLKRFTLTLNFETYTAPSFTSDYSDQTLDTQTNLINFFLSKKSLHSAFAVVFGILIATAVIYILVYKAKTNRKFFNLTIAFFLWCCIAAILLKIRLVGTTETVILSCTMISMLIVNHTNIMNMDEEIVECIEKEEVTN